jgi:hypothetical protein
MYDIHIKQAEKNLLWFHIGPYEFYIKHEEDYGEKPNTYWCLSHADFYCSGSEITMGYDRIIYNSDVVADPFKEALSIIRKQFVKDLPPSIIVLSHSVDTDGIYIPEPHMRR